MEIDQVARVMSPKTEEPGNASQNVLVTGGGGYIGNVVVRRLLQRGHQVRVLDKMVFGEKSLEDLQDQIEVVREDIRDVDSSVMDGIDSIIHLAGFSTEPTSAYDPRLTDMINHIATETLAKKAKAKGINRFAYASSCSVYFALKTPLEPPLYTEEDEINPISQYSLTKRCSEQVLLAMADESFNPIIFRKGTLYGLSERMRYDLVFNSFVKDAFFRRMLTVDAGGDIWRPMIDIQDAAHAYVQSLELPIDQVGGRIFNVSDENWNIGMLASEIKKIVQDEKEVDVDLDVKPYGLTRNYKADATLFKQTFGFTPQRSFREAVLEIWEHLENNPDIPISDPIFYGDQWYKRYFETPEGQEFRRHV